MNTFCTNHNIALKEFISPKTKKPYNGHYVADEGMCFGTRGDDVPVDLHEADAAYTPYMAAKTAEIREKLEEAKPRDYDAENRGKIRSLLLQSWVIKNGLQVLTEEEETALHKLVEIAMGDK